MQPHDYVSPPKWHLGHTTWFFETFCVSDKRPFDPVFPFVFNSYYETVGPHIEQRRRGVLSRPSLERVLEYRRTIDRRMRETWNETPAWQKRLRLGLEHEMQHQELLLMDIKAILFEQPERPPYLASFINDGRVQDSRSSKWTSYAGGLYEIGCSEGGFSFDNECPRHRVFLNDFSMATRLVTNEEYRSFIRDRGYERPELWLSDGWAWVKRSGARLPLYWLDLEHVFTLAGVQLVEPEAPVSHVNYFEADAFARWQGARLPTEAEWEVACLREPRSTHWQWTQSAYLPYPGYRTPEGAFGEYNGKFMCGQMVLRGGCLATPEAHYRPTYRNFFYPEMRWPFSSVRLAR